ncbi:hypothetical protein EC968_006536 [Mortierella alpina]|nr:hypothetical protein EC968_006536 [Mortierella alpina]
MKSIFSTAVFVTVGVLAVLSSSNSAIADASPVSGLEQRQQRTISQRWCDAFIQSCESAANEACGSVRKYNYRCKVAFSGNVCTEGSVRCTCGAVDGSGPLTDVSKVALDKNFLTTQGTCSAVGIQTILEPSEAEGATPSQGAAPSQAVSPSQGGKPSNVPSSTTTPSAPQSGASKSVEAICTVALTAAVSLGLLWV